jgi:hypothetical protein
MSRYIHVKFSNTMIFSFTFLRLTAPTPGAGLPHVIHQKTRCYARSVFFFGVSS